MPAADKQSKQKKAKTVVSTDRVTNWAALSGRWTFKDGTAIFAGPDGTSPSPLGLAIAKQKFRDGVVHTRVRLSRSENTTAGIVIGYKSMSAPYIIAQIGAYNKAYAVSEFLPTFGWEPIATAGLLSNLVANVDYELTIKLEGQVFSMLVNGVNVLNSLLRQPLDGEGLGLFAWGDATVTFENIALEGRKPRVFVIMPFAEPFDSLYKDVIKPVAEDELGFEILRVDEIQAPGIILDDIQRQILASHAVVAEISTRNPNVFYELGYAHALGKPAILLVRREDSAQVPFDLKSYRAIYYDDSIAGKKTVERNLRAHLSAVKSGVVSEV